MSVSSTVRIGVIGTGRWGPNLVRCLRDASGVEVAVICDADPGRLGQLGRRYPAVPTCTDVAVVLGDPAIDAVMIATPADTHQPLAHAALLADKHVFVEKPIATDVAGARRLVETAEQRGRILMSGHVFLYNPAVRELRERSGRSEFGGLRYMYSRRTNLGPVRGDVHAGWDLAAHDVSIFLYLKGESPREVTASAQSFIRAEVPDVVFATLYFADGTVAHLHTSWLDPQKVRQVILVGSAQMLVFDDMNLLEPLRIYHKGWRREEASAGEVVDSFGGFHVVLIQGDVVIPSLSTGEPLRLECEAFLEAIRSGRQPLSDGPFGLEVVRVLEAIDRSIAADSRRVAV